MANVTNDVKRVPVISCEIRDSSLVIECINGQRLTLNAWDLSENIRIHATMHGLKQKLIDAAAISRNPDTGKSATPEDKWAAVRAVYERLTQQGQWNAPRGEGGAGTGGLLLRALGRLYPAKTQEQLRQFLDGKSKSEQAALRVNPRVAEIIETIKAETAKTDNVDTDALLDELDG